MSDVPDSVVATGAARFFAFELCRELPAPPQAGDMVREVAIAGIGTTAPRALQGALLAEALSQRGMRIGVATSHTGPVELIDDEEWSLGIVLSPWKLEIGAACGTLTRSAEKTGVVDTVVRGTAGAVGFNTNTWGAMSALEVLCGGEVPRRVLILGTGASARSVALAIQRAYVDAEIVIAARSTARADALATRVEARVYDHRDRGAIEVIEVIVNTTTWGETEASESEPFGVDLTGLFAPGVRLFDLNNRVSALQQNALSAGCVVVGGGVMQRVTNACRAALLAISPASVE